MVTASRQAIRSFQGDDRGGVAIIFGLLGATILFIAGAALDYSRLAKTSTQLNAAADAAALAAGRAMVDGKLNDSEVIALAKAYFSENTRVLGNLGTIKSLDVTVDRANSTVLIDAKADVAMTFTRIAGFNTINVPSLSNSTFEVQDLEVGMALDITGSMASPPPGGGAKKIDGLKAAFAKFAEALIPQYPIPGRKVRIGLGDRLNKPHPDADCCKLH